MCKLQTVIFQGILVLCLSMHFSVSTVIILQGFPPSQPNNPQQQRPPFNKPQSGGPPGGSPTNPQGPASGIAGLFQLINSKLFPGNTTTPIPPLPAPTFQPIRPPQGGFPQGPFQQRPPQATKIEFVPLGALLLGAASG